MAWTQAAFFWGPSEDSHGSFSEGCHREGKLGVYPRASCPPPLRAAPELKFLSIPGLPLSAQTDLTKKPLCAREKFLTEKQRMPPSLRWELLSVLETVHLSRQRTPGAETRWGGQGGEGGGSPSLASG